MNHLGVGQTSHSTAVEIVAFVADIVVGIPAVVAVDIVADIDFEIVARLLASLKGLGCRLGAQNQLRWVWGQNFLAVLFLFLLDCKPDDRTRPL